VDDYGIDLREPIDVYLYEADVDTLRIRTYTDAYNTFWSKHRDLTAAVRNTDLPLVITFGHELARLTFQPRINDPDKQGPLRFYADDWSHYFEFKVLIPAVWERLGYSAWPIEHDFNEAWGEKKFYRWYQGAEDTYAFLLSIIDDRYGDRLIGETVNRLTNGGAKRWIGIEEFMAELAGATGDTELIRKVDGAYPTSLEYSICRRIEPLGFAPSLDEMIETNQFVVDSVEVGGAAGVSGLRTGDRIVRVNGLDFATQKGLVHRGILTEIQRDGSLLLEIARDSGEEKISLKLSPRRSD